MQIKIFLVNSISDVYKETLPCLIYLPSNIIYDAHNNFTA